MRKQTAEKLRKRGGFTEEFLQRAQEIKSKHCGKYRIIIYEERGEIERIFFDTPKELDRVIDVYKEMSNAIHCSIYAYGVSGVLDKEMLNINSIPYVIAEHERSMYKHDEYGYGNGCNQVCEFCFYHGVHPDPNVPEYICNNPRMKGEKEMRELNTTMCSGNYLNFYDDLARFDIFIIFNEANDAPIKAERIALQYMITEKIEEMFIRKEQDKTVVKNEIIVLIKESEFNCVEAGVQVLIESWFPEEVYK